MNYLMMMNVRFNILLSLAASICLVFSLSSYAEPSSLVPVEVVNAHFRPYAKAVRISGLLENQSEQSLGFKISGLVKTVFVDEGAFVKKGQLLAVLDLEEIDAELTKATSIFVNAEQNLERFTSLKGQDALSLDQLQAAQTHRDVAHSDLIIAQFNRRYSVIKAPESGRILKRKIDPNEWINPGQPVFEFVPKTTALILSTGITDKDIVRTRIGDKAELYFDAYPNKQFLASVSEVAGRADANTQTFKVELRLEVTRDNLLAGFVGHGRVYPTQQQNLALLPLTALLRADGKQAEVYVLDEEDRAHLRLIKVAFIEGRRMAVRDGLEEGERVVVQGAPYLSEGRLVSVNK